MSDRKHERCPGCGGLFDPLDGPTHAYVLSSPACWDRYGKILAREYSDPALLPTHRLSVDTYAVQHPGDGSRRAIQSVGLHLARLMLQLEAPHSPTETNDVMLGLGKHKTTLPRLSAPTTFQVTVCDVPLDATVEDHILAVRRWARHTWDDWSESHDFIRRWTADVRRDPRR